MIYTCYCKKNSCEIESRDDRISILFRDRNKLPYFWLLKIWKKWNGQRHFLMHLCMKDNIPKTHPDHNSQAFGCFALWHYFHTFQSDSHYCKCMRAWLYSISQNSYNTVFYFLFTVNQQKGSTTYYPGVQLNASYYFSLSLQWYIIWRYFSVLQLFIGKEILVLIW